MKTRVIILALVALLTLGLTVPASADPPEFTREHWIIEDSLEACGTELTFHEEVDFTDIVKCNPGHELCGGNTHFNRGEFTLTNPDTDYALTFHGLTHVKTTWLNWYDATYEFTGHGYMANVPGYGPIWGSPGREIVYETCEGEWPETWVCEYETLFSAGPLFDDYDAVCEYMLTGTVSR